MTRNVEPIRSESTTTDDAPATDVRRLAQTAPEYVRELGSDMASIPRAMDGLRHGVAEDEAT